MADVAAAFRLRLQRSLVWVAVATVTRQAVELVLGRPWRKVPGLGLVALGARRGCMPAGQPKPCLLMPSQAKGGGMEAVHGVAQLTAVEMRSGGKLARVRVLMAIQTGIALHAVLRVAPGGQVALRARNSRVFSQQRIR